MSTGELCVDVAGGPTGGAARFRAEMLGNLERVRNDRIEVIGQDQMLTRSWLLQREVRAGRSTKLAVNNVSFVGPGTKTVLLRNALHFLRPDEEPAMASVVASMASKIRMARRACPRADLIVVPTHDMADRVARLLPQVAGRVEVHPHPLTFVPTGQALVGRPERDFILFPSLPAIHKDAATQLRRLLAVLDTLGSDVHVAVTAEAGDIAPELREHPLVVPLGPQPVELMPDWYEQCRAVYFPTRIESFGYPLAEARVAGRPVVAVDSAQNREVAGPSLVGFVSDSADDLESAVQEAFALSETGQLTADHSTFDADRYFGWLFAGALRG